MVKKYFRMANIEKWQNLNHNMMVLFNTNVKILSETGSLLSKNIKIIEGC
jgi:hypothetical protein